MVAWSEVIVREWIREIERGECREFQRVEREIDREREAVEDGSSRELRGESAERRRCNMYIYIYILY